MKHLPLLALLCLGCATSDPPPAASPATSAPRRRRRRRPRPALDADASAPTPTDPTLPSSPRAASAAAPVGEFGSPVVRATTRGDGLRARFLADGRVVCDGEATAQRASTQSPYEPSGAMIARSFEPLAERVIACAPRASADGRLLVRVRIAGSGLPQEVSFPDGTAEPEASCLGGALCGLRMSAFRAPFATVPYEFELPPAPDPTGE